MNIGRRFAAETIGLVLPVTYQDMRICDSNLGPDAVALLRSRFDQLYHRIDSKKYFTTLFDAAYETVVDHGRRVPSLTRHYELYLDTDEREHEGAKIDLMDVGGARATSIDFEVEGISGDSVSISYGNSLLGDCILVRDLRDGLPLELSLLRARTGPRFSCVPFMLTRTSSYAGEKTHHGHW